jgi:hypothetical protein
MKKIILLAISIFVVTHFLFAQTKAGKTDTTQHLTFYSCTMHPDVISNKPGKCPKCGMELSLSGKEQMKVGVTKNYVCPTHLDITRHDPGKCPICHMDLIPVEKKNATDADAIMLSEQQIQLGNIQVDTIGRGTIGNETVLTATLSIDETKSATGCTAWT